MESVEDVWWVGSGRLPAEAAEVARLEAWVLNAAVGIPAVFMLVAKTLTLGIPDPWGVAWEEPVNRGLHSLEQEP